MFGKKQNTQEQPQEEFHWFDHICKFCQSKNTYPLHGGNWVDSGDVTISKTFGSKDFPEFKKFKIIYCSDCGRLSEVEII